MKTIVNKQYPARVEPSTSLPTEPQPWEEQIIGNIWRRAYLDSVEDHVKILKDYGQQIADLQKKQLTEEVQKKDAEIGALEGLVGTLEERVKELEEEVETLRKFDER